MLRLLPTCLTATTLVLSACGGGSGGSNTNQTSNNSGPGLKTGPEIAQEIAVVSGFLMQVNSLGSDGILPISAKSLPALAINNKIQSKIDIETSVPCGDGGQVSIANGSDEYDFQYFTLTNDTSVSYSKLVNQDCIFVYYGEQSLSDPDAGAVDLTMVFDGTLEIGGNFSTSGPNYQFITMGEENGGYYYQEISEVSASDGSAVTDTTASTRMRLETETDGGVNTTRLWLDTSSSVQFYRSELAHLSGQRDVIAGSEQYPMEIINNTNTGTTAITGDYQYQGDDCSVSRGIETTEPLLLGSSALDAYQSTFIDGQLVISDSTDSVTVQFNSDGSASVAFTDGSSITLSLLDLSDALNNPPQCEF